MADIDVPVTLSAPLEVNVELASPVSAPVELGGDIVVDVEVTAVGPAGPQGPQGPQGLQGPAGADGAQGPTGPAGADGTDGAAATISVGTVSTGAAGSSATVTNAGTTSAAVLNFSIPRGDTGATGPKGDTGDQGPQGLPGADGTDGVGVPVGGTSGQVLAKASATDYDTHWVDQTGGGGGAVDSVNGQTGVVVLDTDDVSDTGATNKYVTAAEKTKLSNLSGTNTGDQDLSGLVPKTTTVNTKALSSNVTLTQDDVGDGTTYKRYSSTEKTKLAGIATGATANSTDATLLARANHTGTQSADTITDGTTNKAYTATEKTKLAGIATGADVTNATSVDAAGAVMNSDTSTAAMNFVVDEDNMTSNSATKVPTQQSVKAYVDSTVSSGGSSGLLAGAYTSGVLYIAHRGGTNVYPEHTMEAYRSVVAAGAKAIEQDCYLLLDGALGIMHDSTLTRTTTASGNTADTSSAFWPTLVVDVGASLGGVYTSKTYGAPMFDQVVREFGNKVLLVPEAKNTGAGQAIVNTLLRYKVAKDAALVQSFDMAELTAAVAAGYPAMMVGSGLTPSTLVAAGIQYAGVPNTSSSSYISSLTAAGLKVIVYTIDHHYERDTFVSYGAEGFFSNDPIYLSGVGYRLTSDPFGLQTWYHGMLVGNDSRGAFVAPNSWGLTTIGATNVNASTLMGWACPIGGDKNNDSYTISFNVNFSAIPSTRWCSIFVGANSDLEFIDGSQGNGYHCLFRQSGTLDIYRVTNGVATSIGSVAGTAITTGTNYGLKVTVSPTQIKWERTGSGAVSVTANDTTYRGGYFHLAKHYQVTCTYSSVVVVDT